LEGFNPRIAESEIQSLILGWLLTKGFYAWRNHSQGTFDAKSGRYRAMNQIGARKGVSDILGVLPDGRFLAIEVKGAKGRTSQEQDAFIRMVNSLGGLAFVARSLEDVKGYLEDYRGSATPRSVPESLDR